MESQSIEKCSSVLVPMEQEPENCLSTTIDGVVNSSSMDLFDSLSSHSDLTPGQLDVLNDLSNHSNLLAELDDGGMSIDSMHEDSSVSCQPNQNNNLLREILSALPKDNIMNSPASEFRTSECAMEQEEGAAVSNPIKGDATEPRASVVSNPIKGDATEQGKSVVSNPIKGDATEQGDDELPIANLVKRSDATEAQYSGDKVVLTRESSNENNCKLESSTSDESHMSDESPSTSSLSRVCSVYVSEESTPFVDNESVQLGMETAVLPTLPISTSSTSSPIVESHIIIDLQIRSDDSLEMLADQMRAISQLILDSNIRSTTVQQRSHNLRNILTQVSQFVMDATNRVSENDNTSFQIATRIGGNINGYPLNFNSLNNVRGYPLSVLNLLNNLNEEGDFDSFFDNNGVVDAMSVREFLQLRCGVIGDFEMLIDMAGFIVISHLNVLEEDRVTRRYLRDSKKGLKHFSEFDCEKECYCCLNMADKRKLALLAPKFVLPEECPICLDDNVSEWICIKDCNHYLCANCMCRISNTINLLYPFQKCAICRQYFKISRGPSMLNIPSRQNIQWVLVTRCLTAFRNRFVKTVDKQIHRHTLISSVLVLCSFTKRPFTICCNQELNDLIENYYQLFLKNKNNYVFKFYLLFPMADTIYYHEIFVNFYLFELSSGYSRLASLERCPTLAKDYCDGFGGYLYCTE